MANAQFELINTAGTTLIDDQSKVLTLIYKGNNPPTEGRTIRLDAWDGPDDENGHPTGTCYSFDVDTNAPSDVGLLICNANGEICFDAGHKPAVWVDTWGGPYVTSGLGAKTYVGGHTYAVAKLYGGGWTQWLWRSDSPTSGSTLTHKQVCVDRNGTSVIFSLKTIIHEFVDSNPFPKNYIYQSIPWSAMVLDVTHY